jgi:hypothetical protein
MIVLGFIAPNSIDRMMFSQNYVSILRQCGVRSRLFHIDLTALLLAAILEKFWQDVTTM